MQVENSLQSNCPRNLHLYDELLPTPRLTLQLFELLGKKLLVGSEGKGEENGLGVMGEAVY